MKKFNLIMAGVAMLGLTSCLKDGKVNLAPGASPAVVEWSTAVVALHPNSVTATSPSVSYTVSIETGPAIALDLEVGYTGGSPTKSDITVNLGVSSADLAAHNTANPTAQYAEMPANLVTLPSSVVIKAGTAKAKLQVKFNSAAFDFSKKYGVALKITSVSGTDAPISANYGVIVLNVGAKNKYDGIYNVTGTFADNTNANFVGQYPIEQELRTQTATSVAEYDGRYFGNNYYHPFLNGTSQTAYGGFSPTFNMNSSDVVTSVTNYYPLSQNNRSARIDASGINKWTFNGNTPVKMEVTYWLVTGTATDRTKFTEVWTFVSKR